MLTQTQISQLPPEIAAYIRRLEQDAYIDDLTGLLNRKGFNQRKLTDRWRYAIVLDMDDLKCTNDRKGHAAGDALICHGADAIRKCFRRKSDAIKARVGGDEFIVLSSYLPLNLALKLPMFSIGAAEIKDDIDAAIALADKRMYQCKERRKANGQPATIAA